MTKHTEKSIAEILRWAYMKKARYIVTNVHVFGWETDFFVLNRKGYAYDLEIKITRADFFADCKKERRCTVLETGMYNGKEQERPNRFFYVVPAGLVRPDEVPAWAGLIYIGSEGQQLAKTVKNAPLLHRIPLNLYATLCEKFYYRWVDEREKVAYLTQELERLQMQYLKQH